MKKTAIFFKNNFLILTLFFITSLLCFLNYSPGTWLSGWDTLHPEFDFPLNLKRVLAGVWREEQGLGAVAAHAHMADLPRILLLWLFSIFLPISFLRYFYIFLCLILGVLGFNLFLERGLGFKKIPSFLGSLFYLFNLGTLQHFYVPFEMFPTLFSALPWLFLLALLFLKNQESLKQKKLGFWFLLANFLAAPMAYAPHLWYVYFGCLILFLGTWGIISSSKKVWRKIVQIILITLVANAFWLLPNFYFLATHAQSVPLAKINRLFSQEAFLANQEYGTFLDTALVKNFLFSWSEHAGEGNFGYLLDEWLFHLKQPGVLPIGYLFFSMVLIALFFSVCEKKHQAFLLIFLVSFVFIINMNPPFAWLFSYFREKIPLFKEGLRFPFTKFSLFLSFTDALFFAYGWEKILDFLRKKSLKILTAFFCLLLFSWYMWPAFQGHLISPSMRIKIPEHYFVMFDWFKKQPQKGRILPLPLHTFYGWTYYDWSAPGFFPSISRAGQTGYQGAGFVWFGIKQSFLDRDFDRWAPANEQSYREISNAVYSQNLDLFEKLLEKYQIKWLLLDESIIVPGKDSIPEVLYFSEIKDLFNQSIKIEPAISFGEKISVWKVNLVADDSPLYLNQPLSISPNFLWANDDWVYPKAGDYYSSDKNQTFEFFYPFRTFWGSTEAAPESLIASENDLLTFKAEGIPNGQLILPNFGAEENSFNASVFLIKEEGKLVLKIRPDLPTVNRLKSQAQDLSFLIPLYQTPFFVGINREAVFKVENLNFEEEKLIGQASLQTKGENRLYFWSGKANQNVPVNFDWLDLTPESCFQPENRSYFGVSTLKEGEQLEILTKEIPTCLNISLWAFLNPNSLNSDSLVEAQYSLKIIGSGKPRFSFYSADKNINLSRQNFIRVDDPLDLFLRFRLDPLDEQAARINFEKLSLIFYPLVQKSEITFKYEDFNWPELGLKNNSLVVDLPRLDFPQGEIDLTTLIHSPRNCGSYRPLTAKLEFNSEEKCLAFSSQKGSVCDFFELSDLSHNRAYLLEIESKNESGLPLKICLANHSTHRCELYAQLGENKNFTKEIFVIPPTDQNGRGFDLHFNNYSVGRELALNQVKSIRIMPLPYSWLKNIKIVSNQQKEVKRVLFFPQTFEKNWWAFTYQPPFHLKKIPDHVLVNNWANGWISDGRIDEGKIFFVFWPQILEYAGLVLTILAFLLICFKSRLLIK